MTPNSVVTWLRFLLKVSLCSPQVALIVLIFFQNDGVGRRNLSTVLSTQTNISGFSMLGTFTSMPEHPAMSSIGPNSPFETDSSKSTRPLVKLVGLSTSPQGVQFQNCFWLPDFSGFLCNLHFYAVERVFCVLLHSPFRQLPLSIRN